MCWPSGDVSMSSSPWIVVGAGIYGANTAPKVGYPNGSDGAAPLCHTGMCSRACSYCRLSLLNSLRTRRGMPLTDRLERCRDLFLDSAFTLSFGSGRSGSGELLEDNSSSATV